METSRYLKTTLSLALAGLALVIVTAGAARAEVVAYDSGGWTISFDGRSNAYYSFEWGDAYPHWTAAQINAGNLPMPNQIIWGGFQNQTNQDPDMCMSTGSANGQTCTFTTSRIHTGFVGNDFGFTVTKKISDALKVTGRLSVWWPIETDQYRGWSSMSPDPRESYFKMEGRWGGLLAGRALGLHDRGGTSIDFLYANGHSVGNPCNASGQGPLCGFIGYGYQFPSFNAGFVYNTPREGNGFQLSIGGYDPSRVGHESVLLLNTPYPRVEAEATVVYKKDRLFVTMFVNGMWQRAGGFIPDSATGASVLAWRDAVGASAGGRLEIGGFKLGAVANYDKGGGELVAIGVEPVPVDNNGNLRTVTGALGVAMYSIGLLDLSFGAGLTHIQQTDFDQMHRDDVIKDRLGTAGTIVYHIDPSITWSLQFFRAQHTFWMGQIQNMNFVHSGMDFIW